MPRGHCYLPKFFSIALAAAATFSLGACTAVIPVPGGSGSTTRAAIAYCPYLPTPRTFSSSVTASGTARYQYRDNGNGSVNATPRPIRHAEIRITDSSGTVVQCGETDASGNFSVALPANTGTLTLAVTSRSNNSKNTAYVLNDPTNNEHYSLTTTVSTSSNTTGITLTASATGDLKGGAFNILDQVLNSQEYLRTQTTGCSTSGQPTYFPDCSPVSTIPLAYLYWKAAFNPGSYVGVTSGLSFYQSGQDKLYILGGVGNTTCSDMDHYDNSVIIHEYGHFIEDNFSVPNSPGGSHDGDSIIDPRLAWGEGFANFFQAAVIEATYGGTAKYRDSTGTPGCAGINFDEPIETQTGAGDIPSTAGEGNYREFSVSRMLWRVLQPTGASPAGAGSQFAEIWAAFNGATRGMKGSTDPFKTIGRLHASQQDIATNAGSSPNSMSWAGPAAATSGNEYHTRSLANYGTPFVTTGGCTPTTNSMTIDTTKSNPFHNNHFFAVNHGGGNLSVSIAQNSALALNFTVSVYESDYVWQSSGRVAFSTTSSISTNLSAARYLINVTASRSGGAHVSGTATYTMTVNGSTACPVP